MAMDQHSWYLVTVDFHHYRIAVDEIDETESYLSTYHFTDYCRVERRDDGAAGQAGAPGGDAGHHEDHAGVHQVSARARVLPRVSITRGSITRVSITLFLQADAGRHQQAGDRPHQPAGDGHQEVRQGGSPQSHVSRLHVPRVCRR